MGTGQWVEDILGPGFVQRVLPLEGGGQATLVRSADVPNANGFVKNTAVLHLHGWSDYFYNRHLAVIWQNFGARFYALDLRDYGRNLRLGDPDQRPGYIENLADYDEELEAALSVIELEHPGAKVVLSGHSTGGLIAVLWAHRNPGKLSALALNAPWLEFQYSAAARRLAAPFLGAGKRKERAPRPIPLIVPNFYVQAASENHGAPPWDLALKPPNSFPIYGPWLRAIFDGHDAVARGLDIQEPVLVQIAKESFRGSAYSSRMAHSDIVLDVERIAKRTINLGSVTVLAKVPGAVHDVFLSERSAFATAEKQLEQFVRGYIAR